MLKDEIEKLRTADPFVIAEKITGESYKESELTSSLGMLLHMQKGEQMDALMSLTDDTSNRSSFADYMRISKDIGFEVVYEEVSPVNRFGYIDTFYVLWHPDGILMKCESYGFTNHVNSASIYYNVAGDVALLWKAISSGHIASDGDTSVLVGDHDVREGLRHKIGRLREAGTFRNQWFECPSLWLHPYWEKDLIGKWEYKSPEWDAAQARRFSALPEHVQLAICGAKCV